MPGHIFFIHNKLHRLKDIRDRQGQHQGPPKEMSLSYDNKPSTAHDEFALGSASPVPGEQMAPYEPGGAEEKVGDKVTHHLDYWLTCFAGLHAQARLPTNPGHLVHVCHGTSCFATCSRHQY